MQENLIKALSTFTKNSFEFRINKKTKGKKDELGTYKTSTNLMAK
jgi:hypothetical protein